MVFLELLAAFRTAKIVGLSIYAAGLCLLAGHKGVTYRIFHQGIDHRVIPPLGRRIHLLALLGKDHPPEKIEQAGQD